MKKFLRSTTFKPQIFLVPLLVLLSVCLLGQSRIDSLASALKSEKNAVKRLDLMLLLAENELNSQLAVSYGEDAINLADSLKLKEKKAMALNLCGVAWKNWGDNLKSIQRLYVASNLYSEMQNQNALAEVLMNIGETFRASGLQEQATDTLRKAIGLFKKLNSARGLAKTYNRLAAAEFECLHKIPAFDSMKVRNYPALTDFYNEAIADTSVKRQIDNVMHHASYSDIYATRLNMQDLIISNAIIKTALFTSTNRTDNALAAYQHILENSEKYDVQRERPLVLLHISNIYKKVKNYQKSNEYSEEALRIATLYHLKIYRLMAYENLVKNYTRMGDYQQAFTVHGIYWQAFDQYHKDDLSLQINSIRQENQIKARDTEITNRKWQLTWLSLFFIILIGAFFVFVLILSRKNARLNVLFEELNQKNQIISDQNQELLLSNAQKDKFFSIIAHDLKSPFSAVIGFSDLLIEQIRAKEYAESEQYAKIILKSSHRAMDLLTNLMEWSQSQTGIIVFNPEKYDFRKSIDEVTLLFEEIANQKSITILRELSLDVPVYADRAMINTILRNLISNALKFTRQNGQVVIKAVSKDDGLMVTVSDNGVGIPPHRVEKIFRYDGSFSTSGTNNEKGTGLGLVLCRDFVARHGGKIWVESEEGKHTRFYFTIPSV